MMKPLNQHIQNAQSANAELLQKRIVGLQSANQHSASFYPSAANDDGLNHSLIMLNRLSLELMLFGRGKFAPTAFSFKPGYAAMPVNLNNRLSLELMLFDLGGHTPGHFYH